MTSKPTAKLTRRQVVMAIASAPALSVAPAFADTPVRILVGFPPGGTVDITARRLAEVWRVKTGDTATVDNRSGAGGQIAVGVLKAAAPDGTTALVTPASIMTIYPHVYKKIQYDAAKDVIPVTSLCNFVCAFAIGPKVPADVKTLTQFLTWAKGNPRDAAFASPAAGAGPHFVGALLSKNSGVNLLHVPYRGATPGLQDLIGGQIASGMFVLGDYLPQLSTGKLRLLGVSSTERSRFAPEVPTFVEQGLKDVTSVESYGLFLPAGTPQRIVDRVYDIAAATLQDPTVIDGMLKLGFDPHLSARNAYADQLSRERERWGVIVKGTGFSIDE